MAEQVWWLLIQKKVVVKNNNKKRQTTLAMNTFLDMYKPLHVRNVQIDSDIVDQSVSSGVTPSTIRYGILRKGEFSVVRGALKDFTGCLHYFNWPKDGDFRIVKADAPEKVSEAYRLLESCTNGCDIRKAEEAPLDNEDEDASADEDDAEKASATSATGGIAEEQYLKEQRTAMTTVHPGAAQSTTPDDPAVGRQWHQERHQEPIRRAGDAMGPLAANDGQKHWTTTNLMKAWGRKLQQNAPTVGVKLNSLQRQYLLEVVGATEAQISKGLRLPARHRISFEQWKSKQLRTSLKSLKKWVG